MYGRLELTRVTTPVTTYKCVFAHSKFHSAIIRIRYFTVKLCRLSLGNLGLGRMGALQSNVLPQGRVRVLRSLPGLLPLGQEPDEEAVRVIRRRNIMGRRPCDEGCECVEVYRGWCGRRPTTCWLAQRDAGSASGHVAGGWASCTRDGDDLLDRDVEAFRDVARQETLLRGGGFSVCKRTEYTSLFSSRLPRSSNSACPERADRQTCMRPAGVAECCGIGLL